MSSYSSCCHWWHAPICIAATVSLILAAISTSSSTSSTTTCHVSPASPPSSPTSPPQSSPTQASFFLVAAHFVPSRLDYQENEDDGGGLCHVSRASAIDWDRIVRVLRSSGYVSFSEALGANLDALHGGGGRPPLSHVTVFAPAEVAEEADGRLVRRHVAVGRYLYAELAGAGRREVGTAEEGWRVRVASGGEGSVEVNGMELVEPELYVDESVVVHGIATEMAPPPEEEEEEDWPNLNQRLGDPR